MPDCYLVVPHFEQYQHYQQGDRNPTWIKVYLRLLDGDCLEYNRLEDHHKIQLVHLWMLAAKHKNRIPFDLNWIEERLNINEELDLGPLLQEGLVRLEGPDAKDVLDEHFDLEYQASEVEPMSPTKKSQRSRAGQWFQQMWNREKPEPCPACRIWTEQRQAKLRKVAKVVGDKEADWKPVFTALKASAFCQGHSSSGWKASIDFLLRPGKAVALLEGQYSYSYKPNRPAQAREAKRVAKQRAKQSVTREQVDSGAKAINPFDVDELPY